jgi:2-oxoglutarate ferredoxin oxidoreductase subunit delta
MATAGYVDIDVERCKGCELCIPACPFDVLTMSEVRNDHGYLYPLLAPGCTGCKVCNEVCPDFVFTVYREPWAGESAAEGEPADVGSVAGRAGEDR